MRSIINSTNTVNRDISPLRNHSMNLQEKTLKQSGQFHLKVFKLVDQTMSKQNWLHKFLRLFSRENIQGRHDPL